MTTTKNTHCINVTCVKYFLFFMNNINNYIPVKTRISIMWFILKYKSQFSYFSGWFSTITNANIYYIKSITIKAPPWYLPFQIFIQSGKHTIYPKMKNLWLCLQVGKFMRRKSQCWKKNHRANVLGLNKTCLQKVSLHITIQPIAKRDYVIVNLNM
jgi:hypothetical protein